MSRVKEIFAKSRRLAVLRFLSEGAGYELNTSVLRSALDVIGFNCSRCAVESECLYLEECGLVQVENIEGTGVVSVKLTERGLAVAKGDVFHPCVDRPSPPRS